MVDNKDFKNLQKREEELFKEFLKKTEENSMSNGMAEEKGLDDVSSFDDFMPDVSMLKGVHRDDFWKKLSLFFKEMKKKENLRKIFCLAVPFVLVFFLVLNILTPVWDFSEKENRPLKKFPKVTLTSITNGQFMKDFEDYVSDQFIFRNGFVSLKRKTERLTGKKENHNIIFADDGYLIENISQLSTANVKANIDAINCLADIRRYNVNVAVIPTAYEIMKDKLPAFAYVNSYEKFTNELKNGIKNGTVTDTAPILRENSDKYLYFKSDHHQSAKGAYYTYVALSESLGFEPYSEEDFEISVMADDFRGTMWSNSGFGKTKNDIIYRYKLKNEPRFTVTFEDGKEKDSLYSKNKLIEKDKYAYYLDGNHAKTVIKTSLDTDKKLIIIKDSYAHAIVPFLANHYSEIHMIDLRYYNGDIFEYVYEENAKDILFLYNQSTFMTDTNLSKISSFAKTSPYTSVPDISYGIVPELPETDISYFDDAVFVGDSLTIGIQNFSGFDSEFLCMGGLNTKSLETSPLPNGKSVLQSIYDRQSLGKLYIMLGTNEVAFNEMDEFLERYSHFIDKVRERHPGVLIYIESIMPVTKKTSETTGIKNDRVIVYNEALLKMAKEKQCYYIDLHTYYKGEDGALPDNIGSDGIHLGPVKYKEMAKYLLCHAVDVTGAKKIEKEKTNIFDGKGKINAYDIGSQILSFTDFKDELTNVSDSLIVSLYDVDNEKIHSAVLFMGGGATAEEIAVFEAKDETGAKELIALAKSRIERKKKDFENYIPAEMTKLGSALLLREGNVVTVCIADKYDKERILSLLK